MPQVVLPLIVSGLATIGVTGTAATIVGSLLIAGITIGAQVGLSSVQARQAKKRARRNAAGRGISAADAQQTIRGSVEPRRRFYGRVKVGGTLVFIENLNNDVYMVLAVSTGTISAYEEFFIGDKPVLTDTDGAVTLSPYWIGAATDPDARSHARFETRRGFINQSALAMISAAFPAWSTAHQAKGVALVAVRYKAASADDYSRVHNSTIQDVKCILQGAPVYDPREISHTATNADTWEWSENPALCLYDYLISPDGMGVARSAVDLDTFSDAADICDEFVPLKNGGSERRYRLTCGYSFDEPPADVHERMLSACRGEFYLTREGKIGLRVGQWIDPAITIDQSQIVSILRLERGIGLLRRFNAVRPVYTSPLHGYQEMETARVVDEESVEAMGREFADEARLTCVPSSPQAQRLAKIELYEDNPPLTGEIVCHLYALQLMTERVFRLVLDEYDINIVCRITSLRIPGDLSTVTVAFEEINPVAYEWDAEADEGPSPEVAPETSDDSLFPAAPIDFLITTETSGVTRTGIRWQNRNRPGQVYDVRVRPAGGEWGGIVNETERAHLVVPTVIGDDYDAEVRVRTAQGGISSWSAVSFTPVERSSDPISVPATVSVVGQQELIELTAYHPAQTHAWAIQWSVYAVGGSPLFGTTNSRPGSPGDRMDVSIPATPGDWLVSVRAVSINGALFSSVVGPLAVTVGEVTLPGGTETGGTDGGTDSSGITGNNGETGGTAGGTQAGEPSAGGLY
jgi:hypothetical protein